MPEFLRSRGLWAGLGITVAAVALIITVEPVRLAVHTVLNGLRERPIEVTPSDEAAAAELVPTQPATLQPGTFVITEVEAPVTLPAADETAMEALPFDPLDIDVPAGFAPDGSSSLQRGGEWLVDVDFELLQSFLSGAEVRIPLPDHLRTRELEVRGPTVLTTTWASADPSRPPLVLTQFAAPQISGPADVDLELIARGIFREFLPPVVARRIELNEIALYRDILGLEPLPKAPPETVALPDGQTLVFWRGESSYVLLAGPLEPDVLIRAAGIEQDG